MDIREAIERGELEHHRLEYKDKRAEPKDMMREVVAMANAEGGFIAYGVNEGDDRVLNVQSVSDLQDLEETLRDINYTSVEPSVEFEVRHEEIDSSDIGVLEVQRQHRVSSYEFNSDKPLYFYRRGSTARTLRGHEIENIMINNESWSSEVSGQIENQETGAEQDTSLQLDLDEAPKRPTQFIPRQEGHISGVCTFADVYLPSNPVRIRMSRTIEDLDQALSSIAHLQDEFEISHTNGYFTLNQSDAAWVGDGFINFVRSVKQRSKRYSEVPPNHDFDPYKTEQCLFISNTSYHYPETVLIIYLEPWVHTDKVRHFNIILLTDGHPVDTRPLTRLADRVGLHLGTAQNIEKHKVDLPPSRNLASSLEERIEENSLSKNELAGKIGVTLSNPFTDPDDRLKRVFGLDSGSKVPVSSYEYLLGHFGVLPPDEEDYSPEVTQLSISDFSAMVPRLPLTWHNVDLKLE